MSPRHAPMENVAILWWGEMVAALVDALQNRDLDRQDACMYASLCAYISGPRDPENGTPENGHGL